ncbi:ATP-binding protein [Pelagicoccus albus]|uniref:Histidine kinase/HSP90-like ATPase domain-containing protein n=1 Tax=Pelagicoccus albus TaxID=415222 RepID=A0A7X1B6Y7_9BACT|nr:ATP-binding protein [Pelagicoccus albus]MBC2606534.1 hypothetical protein [Pelagicoccus albus]
MTPIPKKLFLLSISDRENDHVDLVRLLEQSSLEEFRTQSCQPGEDLSRRLKLCKFDLAFFHLADGTDISEQHARIREIEPGLPIIAFTASKRINSELEDNFLDCYARSDQSPSLVRCAIAQALGKKTALDRELEFHRKLDMAARFSDLGSWVVDINEQSFQFDTTVARHLGLAERCGTMELETLFDLASPSDQQAVRSAFNSAISKGTDLNISFETVQTEGQPIRIALRGSLSSDANSKLIGFSRKMQDFPAISRCEQRESMPTELDHQLIEACSSQESSDSLSIDRDKTLKRVMKSIKSQSGPKSSSEFPFDFSSQQASDYAEPSVQQDGFVRAAERLVAITGNGDFDLSITLSIENDGAIELEQEKELLFDIMRELLTNVVRHASAKRCIIALFRHEGEWILQVEDDGVGLESKIVSVSTPLDKIGLFHIRSQLSTKGGQLDITAAHPTGLIARARLPVSLGNRGAERA